MRPCWHQKPRCTQTECKHGNRQHLTPTRGKSQKKLFLNNPMTFVIPNKSDGIHEMIKIEGCLSATRECIIPVSSVMQIQVWHLIYQRPYYPCIYIFIINSSRSPLITSTQELPHRLIITCLRIILNSNSQQFPFFIDN